MNKITTKSVRLSDLEFHKRLKMKAAELSISVEQLVMNIFNEKYEFKKK